MSDGLPEVTDHEGEVLGYERLMAWLERSDRPTTATALTEGLLALAEGWIGEGGERLDDLTLVVIRLLPRSGTEISG